MLDDVQHSSSKTWHGFRYHRRFDPFIGGNQGCFKQNSPGLEDFFPASVALKFIARATPAD